MVLVAALACAAPPPPTATPIPTATPDIPATVTARVSAIPTATAYPTSTPYPTATPAPTYTPYPTPTPVPTATPDIRYRVVTPTPAPTLGPLANWLTYSPRSSWTISIPDEFVQYDDQEGFALFAVPDGRFTFQVVIEYEPNQDIYSDLFGVAGNFLDSSNFEGHLIDILSFQELSGTVLRGSYRMTNDPAQGCDSRVDALFARGKTYTYVVAVLICESERWRYGEEFADRVLNSFTY